MDSSLICCSQTSSKLKDNTKMSIEIVCEENKTQDLYAETDLVTMAVIWHRSI